MSDENNWGKSGLSKGTSKYKGPVIGIHSILVKNSKKSTVVVQ